MARFAVAPGPGAQSGTWRRALAGEAFTTVEEWGDPELDRRTYEMRFEILRGADGGQIGAFPTGRDITDRLQEQARLAQAEEQLRQAQKMEAVGQLTLAAVGFMLVGILVMVAAEKGVVLTHGPPVEDDQTT